MLKISDGNINIKKNYVEQGKDALSYSLHGIFAIGTSFRVMCFISELVLLTVFRVFFYSQDTKTILKPLY